jgi:hypothetical protein
MRLLRVELTRFRSRRAIALTLLAAVAFAAVMVGTTIYETRAVSSGELARAEQLAAQEADSRYVVRELRRCAEEPERIFGAGATAEDCRSMIPRAEWFLDRAALTLEAELDDSGIALLYLLLGVATIVGTTFAGADWASGSMGNQLLFEPRRAKVWLTKAMAVVLGVALFATALLAAYWAALAGVAAMRDIPISTDVVTEIWQTGARGVALAAAAALGAFSLTMLFRNTVGTLGLLLGYAVAGEALAATLPITKMSQWALSSNIQAWLSNGAEVYDDSLCQELTGESCTPTYLLTLQHAAAYLGVLLALAVVASLVAFRRRDVP